jgi:hypothetical protein
LPFDFPAQAIQNDTEQARSSPIDKSAHPSGEERTRFEDVELGDTSYQSRGYRDSLDDRRKPSDECNARPDTSAIQMMMRQQDSTMGLISGTLSTLASQAGLMGRELLEQNE